MGVDELRVELFFGGLRIKQEYAGTALTVKEANLSQGEKKHRCVYLAYTTPVASRPTATQSQDHVNRLIFKHAVPVGRLLALLLLVPTQVLGFEAKLNDQRIRARKKPKELPAGLYGLAGNFVRPSEANYQCEVRPDAWAVLERLAQAYGQHPNSTRLNLALSWIDKGSQEYFAPDRLIAFWVAFNALYANSGSEQAQIIGYTRNASRRVLRGLVSELKSSLEDLSTYNLRLRNNRTPSRALRAALGKSPQDEKTILEESILCVYAVRNSLFHGEVDLEDQASCTRIEAAEFVLARILRSRLMYCLGKQLLGRDPIASQVTFF